MGFACLPLFVHAQLAAPVNVSGWAWSGYSSGSGMEGVGWISLNCRNQDTCDSVDYGVSIGTDGSLSGYAWSANIGWIQFGGLNTASMPTGAGTVAANARMDNAGTVTGWARALAGAQDPDDGWDGWISLGGTGYGVSYNIDTGTAGSASYAWGGDVVVGWIDFSRTEMTLPDLAINIGPEYVAGAGDVETGMFASVDFSFPIRNIGNEHTRFQQEFIDWTFEIEDVARGGVMSYSGTVDALAPQTTGSVLVSESDFMFGQYRLTARSDPDNDIAEWRLDNNDRSRLITIEPVDIDISLALPEGVIVRAGNSATLEWDRTDVAYELNCRITGPGLTDASGNPVPSVDISSTPSGSITTNNRFNFSRYEFTCTEPITGAEWTAEASVEVVPAVQEL